MTTTTSSRSSVETRVTTRTVRQNARCTKCKTVRSRLVTVTTTARYYWTGKCERFQSTALADGTPVSGWNRDDAGECKCPSRYLTAKPECKRIYFKDVQGTTNLEVPCDERCVSARGNKCECSCGGKNHGADHG